jgi:hypothetical protein
LPNNDHWQQFIASIDILLTAYPCIDKTLLGFPEGLWQKYLLVDINDF